jgi:hypothetical protein
VYNLVYCVPKATECVKNERSFVGLSSGNHGNKSGKLGLKILLSLSKRLKRKIAGFPLITGEIKRCISIDIQVNRSLHAYASTSWYYTMILD